MPAKRLFVAIKVRPDEPFMSKVRELKDVLRSESIKWVEEHNIHLTLKFLGETDESLIPAINHALRNVSGNTLVIPFAFSGIGVFGSRYAPRVIWCGTDPFDRLAGLMEQVHIALEPVGFVRDRQNLVPHLTLGRIRALKDKDRFQKILSQYRGISSIPLVAPGMILFESILKKEGPEYRILQTHLFQKQAKN